MIKNKIKHFLNMILGNVLENKHINVSNELLEKQSKIMYSKVNSKTYNKFLIKRK